MTNTELAERIKTEWKPTEQDYEQAQILYDLEKIEPLTSENMFRGALYCILTSKETYPNLIKVYNTLLTQGMDNPSSILSKPHKITDIARKAGYPAKKEKFLKGIAEWWQKTDLPEQIIADIGDKCEREFELRNEIAKPSQAPGMGLKCTSLFFRMCGYKNIVPVDVWVLKFLAGNEYHLHQDDQTRHRGTSKKSYLQYEQWFSEIARAFGKEPSLFQLAVWCKKSSWQRPENNSFNQGVFDFARLFVPLKEEYYEDFRKRGKRFELRQYSKNYNEKTIWPNKQIELRCSYSKPNPEHPAIWGRIGKIVTGTIDEILAQVYFKEIKPRAKTIDEVKQEAGKDKYIAFEVIY